MSKKKENKNNEIINHELIEDIMGNRFGEYSKYIIQERAIPDARDGFKPVQRRILYAMDKDGNTFDKAYRKSAKTVGIVIGNYHPHGDSSVYEAMVNMSQNWKHSLPLIDIHGNNGSIDGDSAAAMRYTEARLSKLSSLLVKDLPYDTVEWTPNYDDTLLVPSVLPTRVPMSLLIGTMGIAAGYACHIPPFNLNEILNAVIYRIKNKKCSFEDIIKIMPGPDFPTGGIMMGKKDLYNAMKTGFGKVTVRAKVKVLEEKTGPVIEITEIPYEVLKKDLVEQIDLIRVNKKIESISEVIDESGRNGLKITIKLNKNADAQSVLNYLYKNTPLQTNYNFNMVSIINQKPELAGIMKMIDVFIDFRKEIVLKRSNFLYQKNSTRIHILEGLEKAISIMDKIIKTIKGSKNKSDVISNLIKQYDFTEAQAEAIANMRLYRLSNTDIVELIKEKEQLINENKKLDKIINNQKELLKTIIEECEEINKEIQTPRRTVIKDEVEEIIIAEENLIQEEKVYITLSKSGYIKRVSERGYKSNDGETGIKDGDKILDIIEASTLDQLIIITDKGNFLKLPVYKIPDSKWKDVGIHFSEYAIIKGDTVVDYYLNKKDEIADDVFVVQLSANGMIKKTPIHSLVMPTRLSKIPCIMKLRANDKIVSTAIVKDDKKIFFVTENGLANFYPISSVQAGNPNGLGLVSSTLNKDDHNVGMKIVDENTKEIILSTTKKQQKYFLKDLHETRRGNKGINLFGTKKSTIKVKSLQ